jgi:hypothetical protein
MIRTVPVTVTITTGAAGSASGNGTSAYSVSGSLLAVYAGFATTHANTDTTITLPSTPITTLLTLTNINTAAWYYPRIALHDNAGAAVLYAATFPIYDKFPINDVIKVAMAQATQGVHTFYFLVEC